MEREQAVRLLAALESLNAGFDEATSVTQSLRDENEARLLRSYLSKSFGEPLFEIIRHIVRQYPDLDPDMKQG